MTGLCFAAILKRYKATLDSDTSEVYWCRKGTNVIGLCFWRSYGFPPQCRPIGNDNFEC